MRSAPYKQVLDRIASYLGEADGLSADDAVLIAPKLNLFVRLAWEFYWWPDLTLIEQRTFRPAWNAATAYVATTEVYNLADGNYYQALQASTGHAPTIAGAVNDVYWAASAIEYSADDFDGAVNYVVGDQARNPTDNRYYQLYTLIAVVNVAGAGTTGVNGNYAISGTFNGRSAYYLGQDISSYSIKWVGTIGIGWGIAGPDGNYLYVSALDVASPDLAGDWIKTLYVLALNPAPTLSATSAALDISNTNCWGLLTPFVRSIEYAQTGNTEIGELRFIWDKNPELNRYAQKQKFRLRDTYVQVLGTVNVVWVEFRQRPSVYVNTVFDSTAAYASGIQIYDPTTGENWMSNAATAIGQSPTTNPEKWDKVPFPYILVEYVAQSVYAALTNREEMAASQGGEPENFSLQQTAGFPLLLMELDKIERQQGQTRQLNVQTGRSSAGGWWYRS